MAEGTVSVDPSAAETSVVTVVTAVTAKWPGGNAVVTVGKSVYGTSYMLQSCRVRKFARETLVIVRKSHQFRVAEGELPLYVTVISVPGGTKARFLSARP